MPGICKTAAHNTGLVFVMRAHGLKNNKIIVQIVVSLLCSLRMFAIQTAFELVEY
jgi:hypothetical protein